MKEKIINALIEDGYEAKTAAEITNKYYEKAEIRGCKTVEDFAAQISWLC